MDLLRPSSLFYRHALFIFIFFFFSFFRGQKPISKIKFVEATTRGTCARLNNKRTRVLFFFSFLHILVLQRNSLFRTYYLRNKNMIVHTIKYVNTNSICCFLSILFAHMHNAHSHTSVSCFLNVYVYTIRCK